MRARVSTLQRMGEVLALFVPTRTSWRLSEVVRELGWDAATTHRMLHTLVDIGLLTRVDGERYELGARTLELAAVYLSTDPHRRAVLARVDSIAKNSGITTQFAILSGTTVTIVASQEGAHALKAAAMLGQRLPIHATAAGRAIMAQLDDDEIVNLLPARLERFTDHTVTSRDKFIEQVRQTRLTGLAEVAEEYAKGLHALAIPVAPGEFRSSVAALTCAGPPTSVLPAEWAVAERELRIHLEESGWQPAIEAGDAIEAGSESGSPPAMEASV